MILWSPFGNPCYTLELCTRPRKKVGFRPIYSLASGYLGREMFLFFIFE